MLVTVVFSAELFFSMSVFVRAISSACSISRTVNAHYFSRLSLINNCSLQYNHLSPLQYTVRCLSVDRYEKRGKRMRKEHREQNKYKGEETQRKEREERLPEPAVPYTPEDLVAGPGMLRRIVKELKNSGCEIVLPSDEDLLVELSSGLKEIQKRGVRPEFLISACGNRPDLFTLLTKKGQIAVDLIEVLVSRCSFTYEDAIRMLSSYGSEIVSIGKDEVHTRLDVLSLAGLEHQRQIGNCIRLCPPILFASTPTEMAQTAENLSGFFSRKQIASVVGRSPQVLLKNTEDLEQKYEYIFYQMCMEGEEFKECTKWCELPLEEIILRHEFLMKCGRYSTPDKKNPQLKMENPPLHRILDSTDENFAIQVAGVSPEEWTIYRCLEEKNSDLSDKQNPFERIKPSQRKAFERRNKERKIVGEHVFDVNTAEN